MNNDLLHEGKNIREHDIVWIKNGLAHRVDGPAIEYSSGDKEWWINDQRHREDGPAVIYGDGTKEWFLNNIELTQDEFNQWLAKKQLNEKLQATLSPSPQSKIGKI